MGSESQLALILYHSKKGIVILSSELLFEFQMREHSEARAKLVCVGVHQECGKHI